MVSNSERQCHEALINLRLLKMLPPFSTNGSETRSKHLLRTSNNKLLAYRSRVHVDIPACILNSPIQIKLQITRLLNRVFLALHHSISHSIPFDHIPSPSHPLPIYPVQLNILPSMSSPTRSFHCHVCISAVVSKAASSFSYPKPCSPKIPVRTESLI